MTHTGWHPDLEDRAVLHGSAVAYAAPGSLDDLPQTVDHRTWRKPLVKNQGGLSACTGFATSSGLEVLEYLDTDGNSILRYSAMFAYIMGQKKAGYFGRDQGCSIAGVVQAAKIDGCCLDELFPCRGVYDTRIPESAIMDAGRSKVLQHSVHGASLESAMKWVGRGRGINVIGVPWTDTMANAGEQLTKWRGRMLGYHALLHHSYVWVDGERWPVIENSHSPRSWRNGFCTWHPDVFSELVDQSGSESIGVSDIEERGTIRPIKSFRGAFVT